jgi:hypothetical protein
MNIVFGSSFIFFQVQLLIKGVLMTQSKHSGYGIHCDIVNPRRLELYVIRQEKNRDIRCDEVNVLA